MLYQFYSNLDSDCLFTMPLADLEEAWGIKLLSRERLQSGQLLFELRENAEFESKPYQSEIDAFYVEAGQWEGTTRRFTIYITKAYFERFATLFPRGNYPELLPDPVKRHEQYTYDPCPPDSCNSLPRHPQTPGVYSRDHIYYWLNAAKTHMIVMQSRLTESIDRIDILSRIPPNFLINISE